MKPRARRSRGQLEAVPAASDAVSVAAVMNALEPLTALLDRQIELWESRPARAAKPPALVEGRARGVVLPFRRQLEGLGTESPP